MSKPAEGWARISAYSEKTGQIEPRYVRITRFELIDVTDLHLEAGEPTPCMTFVPNGDGSWRDLTRKTS